MEKVLKVISDEATSAKGKSKAEVDLASSFVHYTSMCAI